MILPERPTPADLAVIPVEETAEHFVSYVDRLTDGRPLPDDERADLIRCALAHGTSVVERVAAWLPVLASAAGTGPEPPAAGFLGARSPAEARSWEASRVTGRAVTG